MATAKIENELSMTCCLGDHPLQNPKLLPCEHSLCIECIKQEIGQERKLFTCPKCQLSIPLTEKEVDQLPEDVLYRVMKEAREMANCVVCKFQGRSTFGTFQCLDCADVLCDKCQTGHTNSSVTIAHRVASVKDIKEGKYKHEPQAEKQLLCDKHSKPNKPSVIKYYCKECKRVGCMGCLHTHPQPKGNMYKIFVEICKIYDEKMKAATDHVTSLLDLKHDMEQYAVVLQQELQRNKKHKIELENEIHDRATKLIELIEKVKNEILETIKGHFDTEDTSIMAAMDDTKSKIIRIDSLVSYTQAFLKNSVKSQFLTHEDTIMKRVSDLRQKMKGIKLEIKSFEIREAEFVFTEESIRKAFGEIDLKPRTLKCNTGRMGHLLIEPMVLFRSDALDGFLRDLTITETGEILAVLGSSIKEYCSEGKPLQKVTYQVAACNVAAKGDTLFVSTWGDETVSVLNFFGQVKKTIILPCTGVEKIEHKGVAVDDEGRVYISSTESEQMYKCETDKTSAELFIEIDNPFLSKDTKYLCVSGDGDLVLSNHELDSIQVFDRNGTLLWEYKGQGDMSLKKPMGVCSDKRRNIYICDSGNSRIQIIRNKVFLGCVEINGFKEPICIDVDKDNNLVCGYRDYYGQYKLVKIKVWE